MLCFWVSWYLGLHWNDSEKTLKTFKEMHQFYDVLRFKRALPVQWAGFKSLLGHVRPPGRRLPNPSLDSDVLLRLPSLTLQVIFGELFQLPAPPHIDVMYTALLIELCKLQPGSLPQVVSFNRLCSFDLLTHDQRKSAAWLSLQLYCWNSQVTMWMYIIVLCDS